MNYLSSHNKALHRHVYVYGRIHRSWGWYRIDGVVDTKRSPQVRLECIRDYYTYKYTCGDTKIDKRYREKLLSLGAFLDDLKEGRATLYDTYDVITDDVMNEVYPWPKPWSELDVKARDLARESGVIGYITEQELEKFKAMVQIGVRDDISRIIDTGM